MEHELTYNTLQSQATRQVFRYALRQGHLGPLVFLWVLGLALFTLVWSGWVLGLLWTVAVLTIAYGLIRSYLANREVRQA